jgi:hypothetical protein
MADPPDLEDLQRRLDEGLKAFIDADEKSIEDDESGRRIIESYLADFRDNNPKRAEKTRQSALEAQRYITSFPEKRVAFASKVNLVHMKMEQAITALLIRGFEVQQEPFNVPPVDAGDAVEHDPTSSALKAFKKLSDDTRQAQENLERYKAEAFPRAAEIGNLVIRVQCLATIALLMRRSTFQTFSRDKLDVSWEEIGRRISEALKGAPKDLPVAKALDVAGKIAIEIVKVVIEEKLPVSTVHHIFTRLAQILGVRKADTKPGGTDDMLKLLEQLEKENDLLDQLDRTYNQAMDEIL